MPSASDAGAPEDRFLGLVARSAPISGRERHLSPKTADDPELPLPTEFAAASLRLRRDIRRYIAISART